MILKWKMKEMVERTERASVTGRPAGISNGLCSQCCGAGQRSPARKHVRLELLDFHFGATGADYNK